MYVSQEMDSSLSSSASASSPSPVSPLSASALSPSALSASPSHTFISLGYRCSVAGILKRLHLKTESYPFDWMISRLPIIRDCVHSGFGSFMNVDLYTPKQTHTTHYHEGTHPAPMHICNETIYENTYYQHICTSQSALSIIPRPLSTDHGDSYASFLAFNHRDIRAVETQEYYRRCISRFQQRWASSNERVVGLYIHPTITEAEYGTQSSGLLSELTDFYTETLPAHWSMVCFLMVRTIHPYPITQYKPHVLECVVSKNTRDRYLRIYVVYTNRDFIDAGEIFMQNAYIETDTMCEVIRSLQ